MKIYKIDVVVETNRDECSGVGIEISTISKDEAQWRFCQSEGIYSPPLIEI